MDPKLQKFMQKHSSLFEKFSKYILAAVLIIVPLFPKFPLFSVNGTYVAIRFEDLILLLLGVLILIKVLPNLKQFLKDKIIFSFAVFIAIGFVSLLSGAFLTQTVGFKIGALHLLRRIEYIIPFVGMITLLSKEKAGEYLNFFTKLFLVVTLVAFVYGVGQRYLRFPIIITQNEEYSKGVALFWTPGSHINSTFAGHYDEAAVMVMFLTIFITLLVLTKDYVSKLALFLSSSFGLWLLINSLSRIAQVSYLVSIGISLFLVKKYKALALMFLVSLILIGMSSSLGSRFSRIFEVFQQKINSARSVTYIIPKFEVLASESILPAKRTIQVTPTPQPVPVFEDRSTSIRLNVEWPRAIRAFKKNFILGTGYSSINLATDNDYLRLLGEVGLLGFLGFCLVFYTILKEILTVFPLSLKMNNTYTAYMSAVVGLTTGTFLSAVFLDLFEASKFAILFWFILGLAVFLVRSKNYVEEN